MTACAVGELRLASVAVPAGQSPRFSSRTGPLSPASSESFSNENTLLVFRRSHAEPTRVRPAAELIGPETDLAEALARGEVTA